MRVRLALPALFATTALVLSACGGGDDTDSESASGDTRTVESTFTDEQVEIPAEPERVVALWRSGTVVIDIGVTPVATLEGEVLESELGTEVYEENADIPTVGSFEGVDIEKVIEADPDLIVGMDNGGLSIDYDELSEVAPTVILEIAEPTDVWNNYPEMAEILGESTSFEEDAAELEESLAAVEQEYGEEISDLEVTAVGAFEDTIFVDTSKSLLYQRITGAGFGYNGDYTDDPERYLAELSQENIADLADQDAIFYEVDVLGEVSPDTQAILDLESFQQLPAVEAGHLYPITSGVVYTFEGAQQQVEDLRAAAEDLTGD